MRGGYLIIDLNNRPLENGEGLVVDGIYNRIESTRKPVRFSNVVFDGNELRDVDVVGLGVFGSTFKGTIKIVSTTAAIVITDTDVITVTINV